MQGAKTLAEMGEKLEKPIYCLIDLTPMKKHYSTLWSSSYQRGTSKDQRIKSSLRRLAITAFVLSSCRKTFAFLHFQIFQRKHVKMVLLILALLSWRIFRPHLFNSKGLRHWTHIVNAAIVPEASAARTSNKKMKGVSLRAAGRALSWWLHITMMQSGICTQSLSRCISRRKNLHFWGAKLLHMARANGSSGMLSKETR